MRWKLESRVAWQTVAGEAVVMDLVESKAIGLNAVGTFIWTRLASLDDEQIARQLEDGFDVDGAGALRDVRDFLEAMRQRGLVTPVGG